MSSSEQKQSLIKDYDTQLQEFRLTDPLKIPVSGRTNNIYDCHRVNLSHIFHYILKTRGFQRDYILHYKDEKAGFVDEILLHIPDVAIKIVYSKVRASMTVSNFKELRITIQDNGKILTCWCT